ncbi:antiviral reverse transcriptase Drt2 [Bradyrhizobium sp. sGM-13]|uniref:antiviral reverse transcriptase Drt2 n=1 Tax=Bradyrhizobium sp. sGM-13 TaxID=2831781 RepID=UPI001BCE6A37|nr:antiviral reverse transcriptase Drt2 [Bradyrhizobium sp. sGM-13]
MLRRRKLRVGGWYVKKPFAHFDLPLTYEAALSRVQDKQFIIERSFWPLIGFVDSKRKFKKEAGTSIVSTKDRPLRYCSHVDGYIHSFYAQQIIPRYEEFLAKHNLSDVVIGYRKGRGTNVDMAKAAFDEINRRISCCAIALDINSFFDSIDHNVLKQNLCEVLGEVRLPLDWFKVYRSMTQYSWVDISDLSERLNFEKDNPPRPICSPEIYRKIVRGDDGKHVSLINRNKEGFGIPQGSPLSAVLSNIYMTRFDLACVKQFATTGVFYRRYSDDILIIGSRETAKEALDFIKIEVAKLGSSMKINDSKTEVSEFERLASGVFECDRPMTYLGLTYDGQRALLRGRTISRYYRRMTYATRQTIRSAKKSGSGKVFLRGIYRDLTHLGRQNFYTYAKKASAILGDDSPVRQLRRHFRILQRKLLSRGR